MVDKEIEERIFEIFWDYLAFLRSPLTIKEFLQNLLSYTEQMMLAKRLAIAVLLERGLNYEEIDETLKVSKSTVGTVHKQLLIGAVGYQKAVDKILSDEKYEKLGHKIEELILKISPSKRYGSWAWQRKSEQGKSLRKRERQLRVL